MLINGVIGCVEKELYNVIENECDRMDEGAH